MTLSDVSIPNVGAGCTRNASPTVIDPPAAYVKQAHPRFEMGEKKRGVPFGRPLSVAAHHRGVMAMLIYLVNG